MRVHFCCDTMIKVEHARRITNDTEVKYNSEHSKEAAMCHTTYVHGNAFHLETKLPSMRLVTAISI
jgi:hypothetical protein